MEEVLWRLHLTRQGLENYLSNLNTAVIYITGLFASVTSSDKPTVFELKEMLWKTSSVKDALRSKLYVNFISIGLSPTKLVLYFW